MYQSETPGLLHTDFSFLKDIPDRYEFESESISRLGNNFLKR